MKSTMTKNILIALTVGLLAQPLMGTDLNSDSYTIIDKEVNIEKFSKVWQELHRDSSTAQDHLQKYLERSLEAKSGTLDVEKFSHAWQKLNSGESQGKEHLKSYVINLLDNASQSTKCSSATLICSSMLDVSKFSTLWNEVKVKGNDSKHLTSSLNSLMNVKRCTI